MLANFICMRVFGRFLAHRGAALTAEAVAAITHIVGIDAEDGVVTDVVTRRRSRENKVTAL